MADTKSIGSTYKHALIYSMSGILGKAVGFFMLPVYAHHLRGEGYGIIGMIDVMLSVLTIMIGYGMRGALSRLYFSVEDGAERRRLISTAIILVSLWVVVLSIPGLIFNEQVANIAFGVSNGGSYVVIALLTFISEMSAKTSETYILIQQRSVFYSILSFWRLVLGLTLNIYFIVILEMGIVGYLYSGLVVSVVFMIVFVGYTFKNVGYRFDRKHAKEILKFNLPLIPGYIAMFIRNNADRILIRTYLGLAQLGTFEMLFKFATLLGFLVVEPFSKIWGIKRFEIADKHDGPDTIARTFTIQLSIMLFIGIILSAEIPLLLKILTPQEFWLSGSVAGLAVFSRIAIASYYHLFFGLLYAKKTSKISIVQIAASIFSAVSVVLLVKPFGLYGAVSASLITNTFQCIVAYRMAKPYYRIPFEWRRITFVTVLGCSVLMLANYVSIAQSSRSVIFVENTIFPIIENTLFYLSFEIIKEGKIVSCIFDNIIYLVDFVLNICIAMLFLAGLIFSNIIPREKILIILRNRTLSSIFKS